MKIIAPISKVEEAGVFARVGAEELFFGVVPNEWRERYGRFTTNRRGGNNLNTLAEVREVVSTVHREGKRVSVAVNGATHTAEQVAYMSELATELAALDVDAFIVGDIQLLSVIHNLKLPTRLHVSSIAACRNSATARLYYKLGANRIILPRHMSLREIGRLVRAVPELEFEVFVLNDGCPYEEGLCHTLHLPTELGGPICFESFETELERIDGKPLNLAEQRNIDTNERCYSHWRWSKFSRGFSTTTAGQPYGPCGLCAIPTLKEIGVEYIKIAGRDGNSLRKRRSLDMVREVVDLLATENNNEEIISFAKRMRGEPDLCQDGCMCYYPEVLSS
ncbi:MAG: U32 family peptidase [Gammaproteobacteria bacterium]|nr:U32 family peptidase [Gammaproteobacteria bacterium]MDH3468727.1 U32 family peptidase [Gammaproteobacteria bacterium]